MINGIAFEIFAVFTGHVSHSLLPAPEYQHTLLLVVCKILSLACTALVRHIKHCHIDSALFALCTISVQF